VANSNLPEWLQLINGVATGAAAGFAYAGLREWIGWRRERKAKRG